VAPRPRLLRPELTPTFIDRRLARTSASCGSATATPDGTISRRVQTISQAFERSKIPPPLTATIRVEIRDELVRNLSASIRALTGEPIGVLGRPGSSRCPGGALISDAGRDRPERRQRPEEAR
jgi:hypothetical protein